MALWVESELWPNLILETHARGVPLVLVNGRLSTSSYTRWQKWPGLIRPVLGAFSTCLAQDEEQARRFRRLGARDVGMVGDLKAAAAALPVDPPQLEQLARRIKKRPLWLAASTHTGEEEIAAHVHRQVAADHPDLLTIIVPRHPARGDAIHATLAARGLRVARRRRGEPITDQTDVYLADTMGELGLFYRLAGIAFVGGSLVAKGGHNPFESGRIPATPRAWRPNWRLPGQPKPCQTPTGSHGRCPPFLAIRGLGLSAPPPENASPPLDRTFLMLF